MAMAIAFPAWLLATQAPCERCAAQHDHIARCVTFTWLQQTFHGTSMTQGHSDSTITGSNVAGLGGLGLGQQGGLGAGDLGAGGLGGMNDQQARQAMGQLSNPQFRQAISEFMGTEFGQQTFRNMVNSNPQFRQMMEQNPTMR